MTQPRRVPAHALDLLRLIPPDGWISAAALALHDGVEVVDGRITGLRALRSASAITIRRHTDGHLLYARTPTGESILAEHPTRHVA